MVIGRNQNPWIECNVPWLQTMGIPLVRRFSGGGAVYHDPGNSLFSFLMPRGAFTRDQHAHLLVRALQRAAAPCSPPTAVPALRVGPRHDVFWGPAKVSGSAYRLTRHRAYHHGTMLLGADLAALETALRSPVPTSCQGVGAAVTSVRSPVSNLPLGLDHDRFCAHLVDEYRDQVKDPMPTVDIAGEPSLAQAGARLAMTAADHAFIREQYLLLKSSQWTFDKTPPFKLHSPSAGTISVEGGIIVDGNAKALQGRRLDAELFSRLFPRQASLHQVVAATP